MATDKKLRGGSESKFYLVMTASEKAEQTLAAHNKAYPRKSVANNVASKSEQDSTGDHRRPQNSYAAQESSQGSLASDR